MSAGLVSCEDRFADDGTRLASRYMLNHPDAHEDAASPAGQPFSPSLLEKLEGDPADSRRVIPQPRVHRKPNPDSPPDRTGRGKHHRLPRPRPTMPGDDPVLPLDLGDTSPDQDGTVIRSRTR